MLFRASGLILEDVVNAAVRDLMLAVQMMRVSHVVVLYPGLPDRFVGLSGREYTPAALSIAMVPSEAF
jgi:hypothetical protein